MLELKCISRCRTWKNVDQHCTVFDIQGSDSKNKSKGIIKMGLNNGWLTRTTTFYFKKHVHPKPGSILYVKLVGIPFSILGTPEHTGIYVGDNRIVELNGNGNIIPVSLKGFLDYGSLTRMGLFAYVACDKNGNVLHDSNIAQRAQEKVGSTRSYNVLFDNCHQFTSGCITGQFENTDNFFWMLEETIKRHFGVAKIYWRVCVDLT